MESTPGVQEMKQFLWEELELIVRTTENLIKKVAPDDWSYRPRENMRSLLEIAQHLVAIPSVDLLILQEGKEEEVKKLETEIAKATDADSLIRWMTEGLNDLKEYMNGLSEDEFIHKKTKPFYLDHGTEQAKWLVEIVTHTMHHRSQLFTYLKQTGYEVSMFDLY
ncbi:DinB family protein [Evansella tamaricis]|uniref:DinB family protein n=1 Tax=Evansella tamaricis TaxID=2069301 RepID=A0ABS6JDF3_9BACI|nr:DinB family protein [Evansella tamaricis]MBU9711704.1 DinB family protein [Evansella tamaricis]